MSADAWPQKQVLANPRHLIEIARALLWPASPTRRLALQMLATAGLLAVLADALLNGAALGVNVVLWQLALVIGLLVCSAGAGRAVEPGRWLLLAASLGFSALLAVRAAPMLQFFDLLAAAGLLGLALALPPGAGLRRLGPLPVVLAAAAGAASLTVGAYRVVAAIRWDDALAGRLGGSVVPAGRALLVSIPIVIVFGGLFVAADAVFESKARSLLFLDLSGVWSHLAYLAFGFWFSIAALWSGVVVRVSDDLQADLPDERRLKPVEVTVLLLPLALLFLAFVLVQLRYLFGGSSAVEQSLDLTYSQYARRGFFELVVAACLLLPVLLTINWARRRDRLSGGVFKLLALVLVLLLFVVMASAWQRLSIYMDALGLTQLRFYVAACLVWLMLAFSWLLVWLVYPGRDLFLKGVGVAAVLVLIAVNVISPDGFIARTNTSRLESGRSFDVDHASQLSADAVPTLVERIELLPAADRCVLSQRLLAGWSQSGDGLRSFNLSRRQAQQAVESNRTALEGACAEG